MKANAPLWMVSLGQGGGDAAAVGGPDAPTITSQGTNVITFTAGKEGAAGPTLGYGASIEPEGPILDVQVSDPSAGGQVVVVDGTSPFTDYVVTIYGVNVAGRGKTAATDPFQLNYNVATGGTRTVVDDYWRDGTNEQWAVHKFTSNGTLEVTGSYGTFPFRYLLVGGGGGGGSHINTGNNIGASGGGGGQKTKNDAWNPSTGSFAITIGNGVSRCGGGGGQTKLGSVATANGGGGGGNCRDSPYAYSSHGDGLQSDIDGTVQTYGQNGGRGGNQSIGGQGTGPGGGGGGSGCGWGGDACTTNNDSKAGIVIVAYRIGTSSTRALRQKAAAESVAAEAYDRGHEDGVLEGIQIQQYTDALSSGAVAPAQLPVDDKDKKPK